MLRLMTYKPLMVQKQIHHVAGSGYWNRKNLKFKDRLDEGNWKKNQNPIESGEFDLSHGLHDLLCTRSICATRDKEKTSEI